MKLFYRLTVLYLLILLVVLVMLLSSKYLKNIFLFSAIISFIIIFFYYLYIKFVHDKPIFSEDKTSLRYTMYCKNCGWEWMSNTSDRAPSICPNCRSKDKSEIIGWRKVRLSELRKKEKDLRNFFKL